MVELLAATEERRTVARKKVRENVARLTELGRRNLADILRDLEDSRARLVSLLVTGTEFDQARASQMLRAVDEEIARLRRELRTPFALGYVEALRQGDRDIADQAREVLPTGDAFRISTGVSTALIDAATGRSFDLVGEMSEVLRSRLNAVMRRSATGSNRPADVAREIGQVVDEAGRPQGVYGTVATQIERIHRTETHALYETAAKARAQVVARESPWVMQEVWITVLDARTRDSHREMNGAVIEVGESFNFGAGPVSSKVSYEQAQREGLTLGLAVMGPHDAILPASEATNCRCTRALRRGPRKEGR